MDKSKALERLSALESEAQELRKIIEAPEPPPSLLTKPEPGIIQEYYCITSDLEARRGSQMYGFEASTESVCFYTHGNLFQNVELASNYAKAFDTFLLLRHQPGTEPASNYAQYQLELDRARVSSDTIDYKEFFVDAIARSILTTKANKFSPCFATLKDAERAKETIGQERLMHMFKTFHHIS